MNIFESARLIHGKLYIAASRVRSLQGLRFYISEYNSQGHLANDEIVFIKKNIVYREVLNLWLNNRHMYVKVQLAERF